MSCWLRASNAGRFSVTSARVQSGLQLFGPRQARVPHPVPPAVIQHAARQTQPQQALTALPQGVRTRALPQGGEEQQTQGTQTDWTTFLLVLAQMGAVMGTLTDGLHSSAGLQVYDLGAIQLGNLHTDLAVPPLLALFYVVLGSLVILGDRVFASDPATQEAQRRSDDVAFVFLCFGLLAANTHFSAVLYQQGTPFSQMSLILGSGALLNWFLLDRTKQGLILSVVCAIGAPAAELILLHFIPLWHYPKADILNGTFVSWVPWMYFGYIPAVANLARFLWSFCKGKPGGGVQ